MAAKTSAAVKNKWNRENYDRIEIIVPKGKKERIQDEAAVRGKSVNAFINDAIDEKIEREGA